MELEELRLEHGAVVCCPLATMRAQLLAVLVPEATIPTGAVHARRRSMEPRTHPLESGNRPVIHVGHHPNVTAEHVLLDGTHRTYSYSEPRALCLIVVTGAES